MKRGRDKQGRDREEEGGCFVPISPSVSLLGDYGGNDPVTLNTCQLYIHTVLALSFLSIYLLLISLSVWGSDDLNQ